MAKTKDTVSCRLYYYRADWGSNADYGTLEQLLTEAHADLSIAEQRVFTTKRDGKEITGTRHEYRDNCLLLQISLSDPDQPASIIKKDKKQKSAETSVTNAPTGSDFLETEMFALIKDNHVILCTHGQRRGLAKEYFCYMLEKVNRKDEAFTLDLQRIANMDKVRLIHTEGIEYINIGISAYLASIDYMQRNNKITNSRTIEFIKNVGDSLKDLFAQDKKQSDAQIEEFLNTKITIAADGKKLKGKYDNISSDVDRSLIELSNMILNDDTDGYTIKTKGGSTIRADQILTSEIFNLKKLGSSLSREDAWSNLLIYYNQLKTKGVLSQ